MIIYLKLNSYTNSQKLNGNWCYAFYFKHTRHITKKIKCIKALFFKEKKCIKAINSKSMIANNI